MIPTVLSIASSDRSGGQMVDLVTPNLPEAGALLGEESARDDAQMRDHLHRLGDLCPRVLLKGGHLIDPVYLTRSLLSADLLKVGSGHGPPHPLHPWWPAAADRS